MANRLIPRKHKMLGGYSKEDLDKAESYLNENNLLKPPLSFFICLAFYPFFYFVANKPYGEELYQVLSLGNQYLGLFYLIIPIAIAVKTLENHQIKLVLEYFKKMKVEPKFKKKAN